MNKTLQKLLASVDAMLGSPDSSCCDPRLEDPLHRALKAYFGLNGFKPHQRAIIEAVSQNKNVLAILPTGYGKSLCYQLPALMVDDLTVVVSPLISLMKDQVDKLRAAGIAEVAYINSTLPLAEQRHEMGRAIRGETKLLYVSPERFRSQLFIEELSRRSVRHFVVDEAHCISEWGHDFRPDYLALAQVLRRVRPASVALFTATATQQVVTDILKQLDLDNVEKIVVSPTRSNLRFRVMRGNSEEDKYRALAWLIESTSMGRSKGIVYVARRRDAEEVASFLRLMGVHADHYHAGLSEKERTRVQENFSGRGATVVNVIAATNAFGLGIDKPDIRFVVHFSLPGSLEAYYQEAGRAGRDGQPADCILFAWEEDKGLQEWFINESLLTKRHLQTIYRMVEASPGHGRFRWVSAKDVDWETGLDSRKIGVGLSHLHRLGFVRRHGNIARVFELSIHRKADYAFPVLASLPAGSLRLDTVQFCRDHAISPVALMANLYNAQWQGNLHFCGVESHLLIECRRPSQELDTVAEEQLGINDLFRSKLRQLDHMVLYSVTEECRERVAMRYFGEAVEANYQCGHCDMCDPQLLLGTDVSAGMNLRTGTDSGLDFQGCNSTVSYQAKLESYLKKRETPFLTGNYIDSGIALAFHSLVANGEHVRTEVGERVYRYKYTYERSQLEWLVDRAAYLIERTEWLCEIDGMTYVPGAQSNRPYEPVPVFAERLSERINQPLLLCLRKTRMTRPQKEMHTAAQKERNVSGAYAVISRDVCIARRLLLVDDLYDSGATLNECARVLKQSGAQKVIAFALTKTRHVAR